MKELSRQEKMQIAAKKHSNNTPGYRGVSWHRQGQKWQCHIGINGERVYLGLFDDEVDAAHAYDEAALEHFGEYAALNFPPSNKRLHPTLGKTRRIEEDTPGQFDPAYDDLFKPAQSG